MDNSLLQQRLIILQEKEKTFSNLLKNFSFSTEREALEYIADNKNQFDELKNLREEIKDLKWQLMSSKEKQEYLEEQKKTKEKYSDD